MLFAPQTIICLYVYMLHDVILIKVKQQACLAYTYCVKQNNT